MASSPLDLNAHINMIRRLISAQERPTNKTADNNCAYLYKGRGHCQHHDSRHHCHRGAFCIWAQASSHGPHGLRYHSNGDDLQAM